MTAPNTALLGLESDNHFLKLESDNPYYNGEIDKNNFNQNPTPQNWVDLPPSTNLTQEDMQRIVNYYNKIKERNVDGQVQDHVIPARFLKSIITRCIESEIRSRRRNPRAPQFLLLKAFVSHSNYTEQQLVSVDAIQAVSCLRYCLVRIIQVDLVKQFNCSSGIHYFSPRSRCD